MPGIILSLLFILSDHFWSRAGIPAFLNPYPRHCHHRGRKRRWCRRSRPFFLLDGLPKNLLNILGSVASATSVLAGTLGQSTPGWCVGLQRIANNLHLAALLGFNQVPEFFRSRPGNLDGDGLHLATSFGKSANLDYYTFGPIIFWVFVQGTLPGTVLGSGCWFLYQTG